jgi:hypothetical protein
MGENGVTAESLPTNFPQKGGRDAALYTHVPSCSDKKKIVLDVCKFIDTEKCFTFDLSNAPALLATAELLHANAHSLPSACGFSSLLFSAVRIRQTHLSRTFDIVRTTRKLSAAQCRIFPITF